MKTKYFLLLIFVLCLASCRQYLSDEVNVRTTLVSTGSAQVAVSVIVEGPDGNAVTGALVQVTDSSNSVTNLVFDSDSCVYKGNVNALSDGYFTITVQSVLLSYGYTKSIKHTVIEDKPQIVEFRDESGNSVLAGGSLKVDEKSQLTWSSVGSDVQYTISFRTAAAIMYSFTTNACTMQVPAKTFSTGRNYYVELKAQRIRGDPVYKNSDFCSIANSGSTNVNFTVK